MQVLVDRKARPSRTSLSGFQAARSRFTEQVDTNTYEEWKKDRMKMKGEKRKISEDESVETDLDLGQTDRKSRKHGRNMESGELNSKFVTELDLETGSLNLNLNLVEKEKQRDSVSVIETQCVFKSEKPENLPKTKLNINQLTNHSFRVGVHLDTGGQDTVGVGGRDQVLDGGAVSSLGPLQRARVENFDASTDVHSAAAILGKKTGSGGQKATVYTNLAADRH